MHVFITVKIGKESESIVNRRVARESHVINYTVLGPAPLYVCTASI